jgi:hypothetical protein
MLIDLTLVALILLVLLYADRYAAVYLLGAVLAYRLLQFPFDIAIGFVLLQVAMAVARVERPRDGALGGLSPEGERLFAIDKSRLRPSAANGDDRNTAP